MNTSPSFSERLFGFTDLLKSRMRNRGREQEIGDQTTKLVQLAVFGKKEWSYFGMLRQLRIERKIDRKALEQGRTFLRTFNYSIKSWLSSEESREFTDKEISEFKEKSNRLTRDLDQSIANEWGSQAKAVMGLCDEFIKTFEINLQQPPESYQYQVQASRESSRISVKDPEGNEEDIDPDFLYHYELVRPKGNAPKTFTMLYDLFKHSEQRRYTETNQGEKARYKLYRFFLFIGWILFTVATELLTLTQFRPGHLATNYFLIPAAISIMWLLVIYFLVRLIIGTTWVFYSFLVEIPSHTGQDPQPLLLVNSKSINLFETISRLLRTDLNFIRALGETMMSFQEATFARLKVKNQALNLKVGALEDKIKKQAILDETGARLNGRTRTVVRKPLWAYGAVFAVIILVFFDILVFSSGGVL